MSTVIQQDKLVSILKSNARVSSKIEELKSVDINNIPMQDLEQIFYNTDDTLIQRELVSVIGRARDVRYQDFLLSLLMASDPKIVMQAIRGLLCFKNESINAKIQNLMNHQNEMVKDYVRQVFYSNKNEKSNTSINKNSDKTKDVVVLGDTLDIMKAVPSESVHLTFTSPPYYNARDYSIYQSYNEYLEFLSEVFKQVHRITQEGRFLVVNTSPIIIPRAGRQFSSKRYPIPFDIHRYIMDAGFEFIDDIIWVKPEASVKDRNGGFKQHRKPLAYKPNTVTEYVMVYRKKTDKLIDWNIKQYDDSVVESSK